MSWLFEGTFWWIVAKIGIPFLVCGVALYIAIKTPWPALRNVCLHIAVGAAAFTFVYSWGLKDRADLCEADKAALQEKFEKMQEEVNRLTKELADQLQKDKDVLDEAIKKGIKDYVDNLPKTATCKLLKFDIDGLRGIAQRAAREAGGEHRDGVHQPDKDGANANRQ